MEQIRPFMDDRDDREQDCQPQRATMIALRHTYSQ